MAGKVYEVCRTMLLVPGGGYFNREDLVEEHLLGSEPTVYRLANMPEDPAIKLTDRPANINKPRGLPEDILPIVSPSAPPEDIKPPAPPAPSAPTLAALEAENVKSAAEAKAIQDAAAAAKLKTPTPLAK